jgi:hypothetical protein
MGEQDFTTRDQHRADLAELRLEIANSLASLDKRTELIAQDLGALRRETQQGLDAAKQATEALRSDLGKLRREIGQEMRAWRQSTTRQMWTTISVVLFAVLTGVIKLVFFP